jgi:uncharacterized transporter YbjL
MCACGCIALLLPAGRGWDSRAKGRLISIAWLALGLRRMIFVRISGMRAMSTADPPALAFASNPMDSDGPAMAWAAVLPLSMPMRTVMTQILVVLFCQ